MRALLLAATLALGLAAPAIAQDTALPDAEPKDPKGVLSDQRLEVTNKGIAYAAERLDEATTEGTGTAVQGAFRESREAVDELRRLIRPLPDNERAPFEAAADEAEGALGSGDTRLAADAMRTLRQRLLELLKARG